VVNIDFSKLLKNKKRNYLVATQVINAIVALACGKLIAEYILPEQFGLYNLQFAAFTFFFSLLVGPSITFVKASYQNLIPNLGYRPFFITILGLSILLYFALILFFNIYKSGEYISWGLYFVFFFLIPFNIISALLSDQFNVLDKINLFSSLSILKSLAGLVFLVLVFFFIPKFTTDYLLLWGMQLAIGSIGVVFFLSRIKIYKKKSIIKFKNFWKKHWVFTGPLMFLAIWSWINNYFDRYVIEAFLGLNEVGIYNANYSLGSKFFAMLNPIFLVLLTPIIYQDNTRSIKKNAISKYVKLYFILGAFLLAAIYFTTDFIGQLLLSENYSEGFYIIFWIALCFLIMTATFLYETIFYANHNTKVILHSNIISAVANVILTLMLIPYYGLNGAIIAMLASVILRFGFVYFKFKNL
jgi:O-antigen/teichoic acid export membrane protein